MYGKDVERVLLSINKLKDEVSHQIQKLSYESDYGIPVMDRAVINGTLPPGLIYEDNVDINIFTYLNPILEIGKDLKVDIDNFKEIKNDMFTDTNKFNNSYGSPWTELTLLEDELYIVDNYSINHTTLSYIGEKFAFISLLQRILSLSIDAKWAITVYHDYIQRAYDHLYNDNNPSISWDDFNNGETIGNRQQVIEANVQIKLPNPFNPF